MNARWGLVRSICVTVVLALMFAPFVILIAHAGAWRLPLTVAAAEVFGFTVLQAGLSAALSTVFGIGAGLGLLWVARAGGERAGRAAEMAALLPNAVPVLVLLLAVMKFSWARGLTGIVLAHVLLNTGLVAVAFVHMARRKLSGLAELAWVEGATPLRFFARVALPVLARDLAVVMLFVFALCFASFAIPLVIGGSRATTIEVLIYQKIRIGGLWADALGLATLQMIGVLGLTWLLRLSSGEAMVIRAARIPLLESRFGIALAAAPALVILGGLCEGFGRGLETLRSLPSLREEIPSLIVGSIAVGLLTALFSMLWLLTVAYVGPRGFFRRLLVGYSAPSTVLIGFALLIAVPEEAVDPRLRIALGLSLILTPSFYRLRWDSVLSGLDGQRAIAAILGAGDWQIFKSVILPQVWRPAFAVGALASLWAWGDFALSSVVAGRKVTLAMAVHALIDSYRLDAATVLVWIVAIGGGLSFALLSGVGHVLGSKSEA